MRAAADLPAGYRGTVGALAIGQILCWAALYYGFTSFVLPMQAELGWPKATMMGALTLGFAVWGAFSYAVGAAVDRGHARAVLSGGAALGALGFAAWAFVSQPWMLYAVWTLLGAAMAMTLYDPAFMVLTRRYPQHYTQGITALTLVGGFASTLSFPAAAALIAALGWRHALLCIAALLALLVVPLHAWALRAADTLSVAPAAEQAADATVHQALRTPAFWLLVGSFTLYAFATAALWAHAMPIFVAKGLSELQAAALLMWVGPAQVAGRLLLAWAGRGVALRAVGLFVLLVMPLSLAVLALGSEPVPLLIFALLFGLANGLVTIVRGAIVPLYFGRRHVGRIGGAMTAVALLARAAAPLLTAWLLLFAGGYTPVLLVLAVLGVVAAAAFMAAGPPRR